jgi:hypothetical protein
MPIPATSSILECTLVGRLNEQTILNIFHFYTPAAIVPMGRGLANATAEDFWFQLGTQVAFIGLFHNNFTFQRVTCQQIFPSRMARGTNTPAPPIPGTRVGNPLPQQTQWSATTLADGSGPGSHGGNRFTGATLTDQSGGVWNNAFLDEAAGAVSWLYQPITIGGVDWAPVVYRRKAPLQSQQVESYILEDQVRTTRRRVVGRGI